MGTLTLNVAKSTDAIGGITYKVALADGDIDRIAAAYGAIYFPEGMPDTSTTPPGVRAPTSDEIVTAIVQGLANGMMANVLSHERAVAAANATAAVQPISITPA